MIEPFSLQEVLTKLYTFFGNVVYTMFTTKKERQKAEHLKKLHDRVKAYKSKPHPPTLRVIQGGKKGDDHVPDKDS